MTTKLRAATSSSGTILDPSVGDGVLEIYTGNNPASQVLALSLSAAGIPTFNQLTQSLGASGSAALPGGLIVKWGSATSGGGTNTVTYPAAFPTMTAFALCVNQGTSIFIYPISSKIAASFNNVCYTSGGTPTSGISYDWLAVGY